MRMYDIIASKRDGKSLTRDEITYFIDGYTKNEIPDYQVSSLLMAVYLNGMSPEETSNLTLAMANSGNRINLSVIDGTTVDKHSTGGVGDKTSLIVAPIAAACGLKIAKMSGRGLGHTGGTIDKLESIPGINTSPERSVFYDIVNRTGLCIIGQTENLAPADKKMYALRDVTATVGSVPLIAASIMSKKIASGSKRLVLDVKTGNGALMKSYEEAENLAKQMVVIGKSAGLRTVALITGMDAPLGNAVGNSLEIIEAVNTLKGFGPEDLTSLSVSIASNMLYICEKGSIEECEELAKDALFSGRAYDKLLAMVDVMGGDVSLLEDTSLFKKPLYMHSIRAEDDGYITNIDAEICGKAAVILGAGREKKDDVIDCSAGLIIENKPGSYVRRGDHLVTLFSDKNESFEPASTLLNYAFQFGKGKKAVPPLIRGRVE